MSKINWREVSKFLSGAAFAGSLTNFYLYANGISIPFLGYTISAQLLGLRAIVAFGFCVAFFYFGYLRAEGPRSAGG